MWIENEDFDFRHLIEEGNRRRQEDAFGKTSYLYMIENDILFFNLIEKRVRVRLLAEYS